MKTVRIALAALAAVLSGTSLAGSAAAGTIQLAQADFGIRMGSPRSPGVVIEEPRPPRAAIETEGRADRRSCASPEVPREGIAGTASKRNCDEP